MDNKEKTKALKQLCNEYNLYPIVPLTNYSKTPYAAWGNKNIQENDVRAFGSKYEWTNKSNENKNGSVTGYSLLTGELSGIMVLDIDNKNNIDGSAALERLCKDLNIKYEDLFKTLVVQTPNGGYHLYFKYNRGLKNKANYVNGIDIRTDGGIIVLPYTKLKGNNEYRIKVKKEIKEMPMELFNYLKDIDNKNIKQKQKNKNVVQNIENLKNNKILEGNGRNQDLISFLGTMIKYPNMRNFNKLIKIAYAHTNSYHAPPLNDDEIINTVNSALKYARPQYFNEKGKLITSKLANSIVNNNNIASKYNKIYIYKSSGYYEELEKKELWEFIFNKQEGIDDEFHSLNKFNEIKELLNIFADASKELNPELLNLKNGMLDLNTLELVEHDPKYKSFSQVPFELDNNAINRFEGSQFEKLINTSIKKDSVDLIQEMFGLALQNNPQKLQKAFILVGDGSNGKGVILSILEKLVGENNISRVGIQKYNTKFENYVLEGKKLNLDTDSSGTRIEESENFKKATCGEMISVQRKGIDTYDINPTHLHISAMNNLPYTVDKSAGLFRRFTLIEFPYKFGSDEEYKLGKCDNIVDKNLKEKIISNEMDIVLSWALEGLKRVRKNNYNLSTSISSNNLLNDYMTMTDSVRAFANECLEYSLGDRALNRDLQQKYESFCIKEGYKKQSNTSLTKGLKRLGGNPINLGSGRAIENFKIK